MRADQQLYQINPASYQAAYDSAQASLARAQATLNSTKLLAERYRTLIEARAVSKQQYDDAVASQQQAEADVASPRRRSRPRVSIWSTPKCWRRFPAASAPRGDRGSAGDLRPDLHARDRAATLTRSTWTSPNPRLNPAPAARAGQRPTAKRRREPGHRQADLRRWYRVRAARQAAVFRSDGRSGYRLGHAPRSVPNPKRQLLPGMFVHAPGRGRERAGVAGAAARGDPQ